jgi:hypothetical protein
MHTPAARARRTRPSLFVSFTVRGRRLTTMFGSGLRSTILPADLSCPRGRAHSSPAMPAARPASLTPSTPYITPAHRSLVHPGLSTLVRAGSGTLGHLKRTVRSRRRRSPHTGAYASLNEGSPLMWLALLSTLRCCSVPPPSFAARGSSPSPTHDTHTRTPYRQNASWTRWILLQLWSLQPIFLTLT